jgi:hypothetical protein
MAIFNICQRLVCNKTHSFVLLLGLLGLLGFLGFREGFERVGLPWEFIVFYFSHSHAVRSCAVRFLLTKLTPIARIEIRKQNK